MRRRNSVWLSYNAKIEIERLSNRHKGRLSAAGPQTEEGPDLRGVSISDSSEERYAALAMCKCG